MWPQRLLLPLGAIVIWQINASFGQLRNATLQAQGIDDLDYYDPEYYNANITRIVGGRPISIDRVPWQVAIYNKGFIICGGSIISEDWVLTAAHCMEGGGKFTVRAGSSFFRYGGQVRKVRSVYIHAKYNTNTANRDIALMRLRDSFQINSKVQTIPLAKSTRTLPKRYFISGWGTLREDGYTPERLRGLTINELSRSECRRKYAVSKIPITDYMFCASASEKDACQGDSGGPIVRGRIQYGIVSFGVGCARKRYPGVYTNTRKLNKWIRSVVRRRGGQMPTFK